MGVMLMVVSAGTVILQVAINKLGYLIIASHTAARKLNDFFAMLPVSALSMSLATFVSQNKGANQQKRIKEAVKYSNILAVIWGIIATLVYFAFSRILVKWLSGSRESVVIDNGSLYLMINAPFIQYLEYY